MMQTSKEANNLAAFIVKKLGGRVETLKLQKLMYYCNGWSLALRDRALFDDKIEAWKHGPVIPSVYAQHRTMPSVESWDFGDAGALDADVGRLVEGVLDIYGAKSGWALRQMTHAETPWRVAWDRCGQGQRRHEVISKEEIASYFKSIE